MACRKTPDFLTQTRGAGFLVGKRRSGKGFDHGTLSAHEMDSLVQHIGGDQHDALVGDTEAAGFVVFMIFTDDHAFRDHTATVEDRSLDAGVSARYQRRA